MKKVTIIYDNVVKTKMTFTSGKRRPIVPKSQKIDEKFMHVVYIYMHLI